MARKSGMSVMPTITPFHARSIGKHVNSPQETKTLASAFIIPTAGKGLFFPFSVARPATVLKMFNINGQAVSGSMDLGVYDESGNRICSNGGTLQAVISDLQEFAMSVGSGDLLPNRQYYMGVSGSAVNSASMLGWAVTAQQLKRWGALTASGVYPLPATLTFESPTLTALPQIGVSFRSLVA